MRFDRVICRSTQTASAAQAAASASSISRSALSDAAFIASYTMPGSSVESQAHMVLGVVLGEQSLDEEALVAFQKAIEADSTNVDALAIAIGTSRFFLLLVTLDLLRT